MMRKIFTGAVHGLDGLLVEVEADVANGLPQITIVGLPGTAIQESRQRVRAALKNSQCRYPRSRITVNLAPADLHKTGTQFDLPIALSVLCASGQIRFDPANKLFVGELSLNGFLRPIHGIMAMALAARDAGIVELYVPPPNAPEAALVDGVSVYPVQTLSELVEHLSGKKRLEIFVSKAWSPRPNTADIDFLEIHGQRLAKRALQVAAAGFHNVLMWGPPGSGKTLLARALTGILPALTKDESLELTKIYSVAGRLETITIDHRPIRYLHHTASAVSLIGGGIVPRPGEITLAHHGVLFLDEFPEFARDVLEALRQPLEEGLITLSRSGQTFTFPAHCVLAAAMNPCPCGYYGDDQVPCSCSPMQVRKYRKKISGPLLDRIDIHIPVPRITYAALQKEGPELSSIELRMGVEEARIRQYRRFGACRSNCEMSPAEIKQFCSLATGPERLLRSAAELYHLSARSVHRVLKLARTIADLAHQASISEAHIAEALQYKISFEK